VMWRGLSRLTDIGLGAAIGARIVGNWKIERMSTNGQVVCSGRAKQMSAANRDDRRHGAVGQVTLRKLSMFATG
jgi:hypothetical protein